MKYDEYSKLTRREKEVYIDGVLLRSTNSMDGIKWSSLDENVNNQQVIALFTHLGVFDTYAWLTAPHKGAMMLQWMDSNGWGGQAHLQGGSIGSIGIIRYIIDVDNGVAQTIESYYHAP